MDGMVQVLLQTSRPSNLAYIADWDGNGLNHKMDHLVCFMGGSLALGAYQNPDGLDSPRAQRDLLIGKAITHTCYQMYSRMATGLSAEWVQFRRVRGLLPSFRITLAKLPRNTFPSYSFSFSRAANVPNPLLWDQSRSCTGHQYFRDSLTCIVPA